MGEPQWASCHPTPCWLQASSSEVGGRGQVLSYQPQPHLTFLVTCWKGPPYCLAIPCFLDPPGSPSAPLAPPTTPTLHHRACPPQHTYRGPLTIEKAETASGAPHLSPLPLNPQTEKIIINKFRFLVDT